MYLFDDVIRPLNNWALYKKKATVREKCLAQELNTMVSTKLSIRGPVVLPMWPGY